MAADGPSEDERVRRSLRAMTVEGVRVVAFDGPEQTAYFPEYAHVPSEVIRGVSDPLEMIEGSKLDGIMTVEQLADVRALVETMRVLFDEHPRRDPEITGAAWGPVRVMARDVLVKHGWGGKPEGGYWTFVQS